MENIRKGIKEVCNVTGVPYQEGRIPNLKNRGEGQRPCVYDHYSERSMEIVRNSFEYEINRFGYSFPKEEDA